MTLRLSYVIVTLNYSAALSILIKQWRNSLEFNIPNLYSKKIKDVFDRKLALSRNKGKTVNLSI